MNESEAVKYMVATEGWQIIQRDIDSKVQYHKDQLMTCDLNKVEYHRIQIDAIQNLKGLIQEKIDTE